MAHQTIKAKYLNIWHIGDIAHYVNADNGNETNMLITGLVTNSERVHIYSPGYTFNLGLEDEIVLIHKG